jgi:hypothetical protein
MKVEVYAEMIAWPTEPGEIEGKVDQCRDPVERNMYVRANAYILNQMYLRDSAPTILLREGAY